MKILCDRKELVEAVLNIQRAVSSKSSIPALEGILLQTKGTDLFLCGYDLELGMTTTLSAKVEQPGSVVLSARLFGDIVRRLPGDEVSLSVDEKNVAAIVSGASEFSIAGIPAEEYPELPAVSGETSLEIPNGILKSMIRQTLFAVSESDMKPVHTGTLFELNVDQLRLISVDGYRLAVREEPIACSQSTSFVVPGKTLSEVLKLLPEDDETLMLHVGRRHILFQIGSYTLISRLLEGDFLDYRAAIPATHTIEITVNTRTFINSVERVSLLITDRLKSPLRCVFGDNQIQLSCSTAIGRANDEFPAQGVGDSLEMGFNNRYLLDALRNTECDEVKIQLSGPLNPMKVVPKNGSSFLFLVLPVRLKSGV